ncbi:MAG: hypothetical protein IJ362_07120 [Oscillospiraceae bacterium]|nr:hypothetical protein [Oscillospiraceae bacterium]
MNNKKYGFIIAVIFAFIIYNILCFEYAYADGNFARASKTSNKITINAQGHKKSYVVGMQVEDISFSPTGRYLLVEKSVKGQHHMEICDTSLFSDDLWYLVVDNADSVIERIIRAKTNVFFDVPADKNLSFGFDGWHKSEDCLKISYELKDTAGNTELSGYAWIDYQNYKLLAAGTEI